MSAKTKVRRAEAQLAFDALTIEGGLVSPEWLAKVAQLAASHQSEADYRIPKGLQLRDEIGRYWRIAQAHWAELQTGLERGADRRALAERFATGLLRESFGFGSLSKTEPVVIAERSYPIGWSALARILIEELYADFAALWLVAHETRFGRPDRPVTECALEAWREAGRQEGTRARDKLRGGVEEALAILGQASSPTRTTRRSTTPSPPAS